MSYPLKGIINKDPIVANKFTFIVDGSPLIVTAISALEEEIPSVTLPDGTTASSGRTESTEFTVDVPNHHDEEIEFFNAWWATCQEPVAPNAYKPVVIEKRSSQGEVVRVTTILGSHLSKREEAEMSMEDGETMTVTRFTLKVDMAFHS
jgi:hypothetical protein